MKPKIVCLPNGPYQFHQDTDTRVALCRCGGSKSKPTCDGTHRTNGFSDRNLADKMLDRRVAYAGRDITIFDNRSICSHAGFCTDGLKGVFRMKAEPWIDADGAAREAVIATVRQCPSGALSYAVHGAEGLPPQREPMVTPTRDGPYAVTGGVELVDVAFGDGASREHYTLCRCGASKNKPFCDGSHWQVGFKDPKD